MLSCSFKLFFPIITTFNDLYSSAKIRWLFVFLPRQSEVSVIIPRHLNMYVARMFNSCMTWGCRTIDVCFLVILSYSTFLRSSFVQIAHMFCCYPQSQFLIYFCFGGGCLKSSYSLIICHPFIAVNQPL